MATDIGRISAAIAGVEAVEYGGPEKEIALEFLANLRDSVKKDKAARVDDPARDAVRSVFERLFGVDSK